MEHINIGGVSMAGLLLIQQQIEARSKSDLPQEVQQPDGVANIILIGSRPEGEKQAEL